MKQEGQVKFAVLSKRETESKRERNEWDSCIERERETRTTHTHIEKQHESRARHSVKERAREREQKRKRERERKSSQYDSYIHFISFPGT